MHNMLTSTTKTVKPASSQRVVTFQVDSDHDSNKEITEQRLAEAKDNYEAAYQEASLLYSVVAQIAEKIHVPLQALPDEELYNLIKSTLEQLTNNAGIAEMVKQDLQNLPSYERIAEATNNLKEKKGKLKTLTHIAKRGKERTPLSEKESFFSKECKFANLYSKALKEKNANSQSIILNSFAEFTSSPDRKTAEERLNLLVEFSNKKHELRKCSKELAIYTHKDNIKHVSPEDLEEMQSAFSKATNDLLQFCTTHNIPCDIDKIKKSGRKKAQLEGQEYDEDAEELREQETISTENDTEELEEQFQRLSLEEEEEELPKAPSAALTSSTTGQALTARTQSGKAPDNS